MNDFEAKPIEPSHLYATLAHWVDGTASAHRTAAFTVDRDVLATLLHQDPVKIERFAGKFISSSTSAVHDIQDALTHRNWMEASRVAHRLKSAAATVGASPLALTCAALERACAATDEREISRLAQDLPDLLRKAAIELGVSAPDR
jgi:HPt (histidine-containing phosphotransfer) domain-containing protein